MDIADQESVQKILAFVTGCSCLPVDGLNPPFTIMKSVEVEVNADGYLTSSCAERVNLSLPKSHTCFNQIVLPPYTTLDVLRERLFYALDNAGVGFYMQ